MTNMPPPSRPRPIRVICALGVVALLAACSGDQTVREGPQAVHPSPSELAKVPLFDCGIEGQPACA